MKNTIGIVDYNVGNLGSVKRMIDLSGGQSILIQSSDDLHHCDKLLLPGVGAFDHGIQQLRGLDYFDTLNERVLEHKVPILGICLGMQLMCKSSEEGNDLGLGWLNASVEYIKGRDIRVPHMGWNELEIANGNSIIPADMEHLRYYFVHSYAVKCTNKSDIVATSYYGSEFVSAFQKENIYGVQFHPEKSHRFGRKLFENFVAL